LQKRMEVLLYREMLKNLVLKELNARYKGSVLGFLWSFFNPLLMLVIYSVVFSLIMKAQIENFPVFIFVAILPWNFLVNSVLMGSTVVLHNANLVKKIYFPRSILPLSIVISNMINYVFSLLILIPALMLYHIKIGFVILYFPAVLFIQAVFVLALTLAVSALTVYLRDLQHITSVLMTAWFFLTPVFYPLNFLPQEYQILFSWNPMTPLINEYRNIFLYNTVPDFFNLTLLLVIFLLFLVASLTLFNRLQRYFAEEI